MILSHRLACSFSQKNGDRSNSGKRIEKLIKSISNSSYKSKNNERILTLPSRLARLRFAEIVDIPVLQPSHRHSYPDVADVLVVPETSPAKVQKLPSPTTASELVSKHVGNKAFRRSSLYRSLIAPENGDGVKTLRRLSPPGSRLTMLKHHLTQSRLVIVTSTHDVAATKPNRNFTVRSLIAVGSRPLSGKPLAMRGEQQDHLHVDTPLVSPKSSNLVPFYPSASGRTFRSTILNNRSSRQVAIVASSGFLAELPKLGLASHLGQAVKSTRPGLHAVTGFTDNRITNSMTDFEARSQLRRSVADRTAGASRHHVAHRRAVPPAVMKTTDAANSARSASLWSSAAPSRGRSAAGMQHSQHATGDMPVVVNLTGELVVDGRRLGQLTASSQAKEASLPSHGPSRVNLRAVPLFTGTQVPR